MDKKDLTERDICTKIITPALMICQHFSGHLFSPIKHKTSLALNQYHQFFNKAAK